MWRRLLFLLLATVIAVLANGCAADQVELTVYLTDYAFDPLEIEVPAGADVSLTLINDGKLEHNMIVMALGTLATTPFDADDVPNVYWEHRLDPASSAVINFTAPGAPGEYELVCSVPDHLEQGMQATLIVK